MSYEHLMELIYREFPHLRGQLERPQVVFVRAKQKVYVSFKSMTLVEEATFLRMEKLVQQCFPATAVALRVVSPGLAEDFRRVHFRKGRNEILARVENGHWNFGWSLCISTRD